MVIVVLHAGQSELPFSHPWNDPIGISLQDANILVLALSSLVLEPGYREESPGGPWVIKQG